MGDGIGAQGRHAGALGALIALLGTAPAPGLPEGLYYPGQLAKFAAAAGLTVESDSSAPTIEEMVRAARARLRERYGEPPLEEESDETAAGSGAGAPAPDGGDPCPEPGFEDVAPVARLRDRLAAALWAPDAAVCREGLAEIAADFRLIPGLTAQDTLTVRPITDDFVAILAARLVGASLQLVADGFRGRLRRCAARMRAKRRRDRLFGEYQSFG